MKVGELLDLLPMGTLVNITDAEGTALESVETDMRSYSHYRGYDVGAIVPIITQATWTEPQRAALIVMI